MAVLRVLSRVGPSLKPSGQVRWRSFGYLPSGRKHVDIFGRMFGYPNFAKRVQAPGILRSMGLIGTDRVLDLGCGSGFISVEIAKMAGSCVGLDRDPVVFSAMHAPNLQGRLSFVCGDATDLPFGPDSFDKVLCSEVLMVVADPQQTLSEIARVLRPGGRLVVVAGLGHPGIDTFFKRAGGRKQWLVLLAHYLSGVDSYAAYLEKLDDHYGIQLRGVSEEDYIRLLGEVGFAVERVEYAAPPTLGSMADWIQFWMLCLFGRPNLGRGGAVLAQAVRPRSLDSNGGERYPGTLVLRAHHAGDYADD